MPSPLSAGVLRAITFPSHLRSPFVYTKKDPSRFFHRSVNRAVDVGLQHSAAPNSKPTFGMYRRRVVGSVVAQSTGDGWREGIRSCLASFPGGERKSAEGGVVEDRKKKGRGQEMGSLHHHYEVEEVEEEMDGGYKKVLQHQCASSSKQHPSPTSVQDPRNSECAPLQGRNRVSRRDGLSSAVCQFSKDSIHNKLAGSYVVFRVRARHSRVQALRFTSKISKVLS
ncbi:hypothetical protein KSP40_PGU013254 [Platanthera guangdongensis]|uniref:Uncharacterized protein n=1 Tax=Platanthera guangdongensis TaxID=2320717 RepID=A0ABR2MMK4_9ASPA